MTVLAVPTISLFSGCGGTDVGNFEDLPLTDAEFTTIASNVAPYLR